MVRHMYGLLLFTNFYSTVSRIEVRLDGTAVAAREVPGNEVAVAVVVTSQYPEG